MAIASRSDAVGLSRAPLLKAASSPFRLELTWGSPMRRFLCDNGLSLALFGLFAVSIIAQALIGWRARGRTSTPWVARVGFSGVSRVGAFHLGGL